MRLACCLKHTNQFDQVSLSLWDPMVRFLRCLVIALAMLPVIAAGASSPQAGDAGDAGAANESSVQSAVIKKRVVARWDALIRKDFAAAYEFASPAYRSTFSLDAFKRNFALGRVAWRRVDVASVDFKGDDAAEVGVRIYFLYHQPQVGGPVEMSTTIRESWVRVGEQWWYLVKE